MKRDLALARRIMLDIEAAGADGRGHSGWDALIGDGYTPGAIQYHVQLLNDAGLIHAEELIPGQWWPERMTWAGHEFLDAARSEARWNQATRRVEEAGGSAPFEVVYELLTRIVRESLQKKPKPKRRHK